MLIVAEGAAPIAVAPGVHVDHEGTLGSQGHHVIAFPRYAYPWHKADMSALAGTLGGTGTQREAREKAMKDQTAQF
ncbi:hypothetical protein chiPu_0022131 [Chiloscyllium punctatum]|uniref:Uncharacterized protein n=1 Tax=Chiloscyllium punctatum TaxID=137246 RepID=A0A401RKS6_CHIPU|nr:hypothetical protein [Chiloscyllium punctatum]